MNKGRLLLILTLFFTPQFAFAQGIGPYGAIDVGQSERQGACSASRFAGETFLYCNDTSPSYRIAAGYQFNETVAIEGGYANFGAFSYYSTGGTYIASSATKGSAIQIAAIGYLPLQEKFSIFGKVGLSRWTLEAKSAFTTATLSEPSSNQASGIDVLYGFGAKYDLSDTLSFRAQYEISKAGNDSGFYRSNFNLLSIGAIFKY